MTTQEPPLERLYRARDDLDAAANQIPSLPPADVARALSSYYRISLALLHHSCALLYAIRMPAVRAHTCTLRWQK